MRSVLMVVIYVYRCAAVLDIPAASSFSPLARVSDDTHSCWNIADHIHTPQPIKEPLALLVSHSRSPSTHIADW